ncbi:MAG: ABC transporter ATP-binding protein/permease [Deltaproteobacteria bacterium]|nr:ABC transporter ATP-binding protein/permease [Deltaproteobacteria bacterium]
MAPILNLARFIRPYGKRAALALLLLTALVCMDLAIPRLVQRIIDEGIARGDQGTVLGTALGMIVISLVSALLAVGNNLLSVQAAEGVARDLRDALFIRIQTFSFADLDALKTGSLLVRLTSDTNAVQRVVMISLRIGTRAPLLMLGSLILMVLTSPRLALVMLPVLVLTSAVIVFFIVRMEPLFGSVQRRLDRLNTILQENISGARLVKAFVRADFEGERFAAANEELTGRAIRVMRILSGMPPVLSMCVNAGVVIVIWVGGLDAVEGDLTVGQIVAFTNYLLTTMAPLIMMTFLSNIWAAGIVSARRIDEVLRVVPAVQDAADASPLPRPVRGRLAFEKVSFRYGGEHAENVLDGIDLIVEPGQTVAFLGATGSGKSTLVNLVPRFYDPTAGRILLDGIDLRSVKQESLLAEIAVVPQETVLFSGTVRENIRYGAPEAGESEIVEAARAAQAHDFITALSKGYDTYVEERGTNLSGGQKQRIAIARALLMRPRILILDDGTSAVDVETETRIQEALASERDRTTLVVAQRISTVLRADRIVVLEGGRIAAQGSHAELMAVSPIYREIFDSQLGNDFSTAPLNDGGGPPPVEGGAP